MKEFIIPIVGMLIIVLAWIYIQCAKIFSRMNKSV